MVMFHDMMKYMTMWMPDWIYEMFQLVLRLSQFDQSTENLKFFLFLIQEIFPHQCPIFFACAMWFLLPIFSCFNRKYTDHIHSLICLLCVYCFNIYSLFLHEIPYINAAHEEKTTWVSRWKNLVSKNYKPISFFFW